MSFWGQRTKVLGKLGNIVAETFVILDVSSNVPCLSTRVETLLRKHSLLPGKQKCFLPNSETFDVSLCFSLMFPSVCPLWETWRNIGRKQCFLVCPGLNFFLVSKLVMPAFGQGKFVRVYKKYFCGFGNQTAALKWDVIFKITFRVQTRNKTCWKACQGNLPRKTCSSGRGF
jgi:hypothetical protein